MRDKKLGCVGITRGKMLLWLTSDGHEHSWIDDCVTPSGRGKVGGKSMVAVYDWKEREKAEAFKDRWAAKGHYVMEVGTMNDRINLVVLKRGVEPVGNPITRSYRARDKVQDIKDDLRDVGGMATSPLIVSDLRKSYRNDLKEQKREYKRLSWLATHENEWND